MFDVAYRTALQLRQASLLLFAQLPCFFSFIGSSDVYQFKNQKRHFSRSAQSLNYVRFVEFSEEEAFTSMLRVCIFFWATVICGLTVVNSLDCSTAPTEALRIVCQQIARWDESSRKTPPPTSVKPPAIAGKAQLAAEFAPIASNMYQCMDMACLCVFFRGIFFPIYFFIIKISL
ncbi:unnamed protein product [Strongylus vulgaris]|uniref:Uncharacterized protein n=1 Tax=Strongylus vulgaris TaxID=40348 RepID=A0A3P7LGL4_STRVU|nr:unnamed protein product [Strongylus vulgaris]